MSKSKVKSKVKPKKNIMLRLYNGLKLRIKRAVDSAVEVKSTFMKVLWVFGTVASLLYSYNTFSQLDDTPYSRVLTAMVCVVFAIAPLPISALIPHRWVRWGAFTLLVLLSILASASTLMNQSNKSLNENYKESAVYKSALGSKEALKDSITTHRETLTGYRNELKVISANVARLEAQKATYEVSRVRGYDSFPANYTGQKRAYAKETQEALGKKSDAIIKEQSKSSAINDKIAVINMDIISIQKEVAKPIPENLIIDDARYTKGLDGLIKGVYDLTGIAFESLRVSITVGRFTMFEVLICWFSYAVTSSRREQRKSRQGTPTPTGPKPTKTKTEDELMNDLEGIPSLHKEPSLTSLKGGRSPEGFLLSDVNTYLDAMFVHASKGEYSMGYKKIAKSIAFAEGKAKKVVGFLNTILVTEVKDGQTLIKTDIHTAKNKARHALMSEHKITS